MLWPRNNCTNRLYICLFSLKNEHFDRKHCQWSLLKRWDSEHIRYIKFLKNLNYCNTGNTFSLMEKQKGNEEEDSSFLLLLPNNVRNLFSSYFDNMYLLALTYSWPQSEIYFLRAKKECVFRGERKEHIFDFMVPS